MTLNSAYYMLTSKVFSVSKGALLVRKKYACDFLLKSFGGGGATGHGVSLMTVILLLQLILQFSLQAVARLGVLTKHVVRSIRIHSNMRHCCCCWLST